MIQQAINKTLGTMAGVAVAKKALAKKAKPEPMLQERLIEANKRAKERGQLIKFQKTTFDEFMAQEDMMLE